jgi:hypothetical protein
MRFWGGAWLPSTSMSAGAAAEALLRRLRPTLLTLLARARSIAALASTPTLARDACNTVSHSFSTRLSFATASTNACGTSVAA